MDDIERRQLLLTAVGGSLLTLAGGDNARGQTSTNALAELAPKKIPISPILDRVTVTNVSAQIQAWQKIKERISGTTAWLKVFDNSFEQGIYADLSRVASEEKNQFTHNPRLVEPLLGEISALLDRCFNYRKEGSELEILGVAAGASRILADAVQEIDRKIAEIDLTGSVADIIAKEYPEAANLFNNASDVNLGRGHSKEATAQVAANLRLSKASEERQKLLLQKLTFSQDVERQLLGRHDVSGNAHNFGERFEQIRKLYESDILSAYRRALAASAGLASIFGYTSPLPDLTKTGFLDQLIIWTRDAMRAVTRIGESEFEFIRQIAVNIPTSSGSSSISLDNSFSGLKHVRIRSIAAAFALEGGDTKNDTNGNASFGLALVKTENKLGPRVCFVIPNVKQFSAQREPSSVEGGLLYNVDPKGNWSARLSAKGINGAGVTFDRAGIIKQLVLQFRVVAIPDSAQDGTFWMTEDRV